MIKYFRTNAGIDQGTMAAYLELSQSAYSRIESGDTVVNVWQLRKCCEALGSSPSQVLSEVQFREEQLQAQGVEIVPEKRTNPGAALIGIAILAALLASGG
ncbi:MAG TPA: helix-turn-helix transcriptional regulator [Albitalea sp.]